MTEPPEKKIEIILTDAPMTSISLVIIPAKLDDLGNEIEPQDIMASAFFDLMQKNGEFYTNGSMGLQINVDKANLLKFWADSQNQVTQAEIG